MRKISIVLSFVVSIIIVTIFLDACKKKDSSFATTPLTFTRPDGWPVPPTNIFATNPLTEEGFQLGRKLFYDGKLSKDGNFPCASCHQQSSAFATFDHDLSHGFNNSFTTRNTPGLFNLAWMTKMHWDGGINNIEVQPLAPITAPNEMAENIENVLNKLRNDAAYPPMFAAAFGDAQISSQRMLKALTQFMGSMVSANAKYDKVKRGEATFTISEENGYNTFKQNCESCHKEPLFTDNSFRNNGLTVSNTLLDFGRMKITNNKQDSLKFKVPSLRNVQLTFPYMHDGRIALLSQAIEHYRTGIQKDQPTLDPLLINGITMTDNQRTELVLFLNTLTDNEFVNNVRFAGP
jgi:cytochrome c peroxidase